MIAYIKGEIAELTEDNLVLEVNGIGYNIKISPGTAGLLPGLHREVKMYTYTHVREDAFWLYGFLTREDLEIFRKLITVNGIGPKGGLAILSVMTAEELRFAIAAGDAKAIARAPGVGVRTAERVILDLRDKVSGEDCFVSRVSTENPGTSGDSGRTGRSTAGKEAAEALTALGYPAAEALKAVRQVEISQGMDAEAVLKQALKHLL